MVHQASNQGLKEYLCVCPNAHFWFQLLSLSLLLPLAGINGPLTLHSQPVRLLPFHVLCFCHWQTDQGIKNVPVDRAAVLAGVDPDYGIKDLYNAIEAGQHVSYAMYVCACMCVCMYV